MSALNCYVGIDLGSTTTKAVVLDERARILGHGITNSRSNYTVACDVAQAEAMLNARFGLLDAELTRASVAEDRRRELLEELQRGLRAEQYRAQLKTLERILRKHFNLGEATGPVGRAVDGILERMQAEIPELYAPGASRKSDFFRNLAGGRYMQLAEEASRQDKRLSFDRVVGLFDKTILEVENLSSEEDAFARHAESAAGPVAGRVAELETAVATAAAVRFEVVASVGTGYGRQTLPFPKDCIRSEILCHGLGAHAMFPATRTVLDIGGQDTKAIQVDGEGIVTSFQMNDRCAAGCGRYLGYIADEMNVGVHELGPMACQSSKPVRINSTCTVFAGAELRERLSLGEKREDILAGLHRAIILRAMSLIARSGGITDEFTFTGGVARNPAAVAALAKLVEENYGKLTTNISPDSIYTGALGAALFAHRDQSGERGAETRERGMSDQTLLTAGIDVGSSAVQVAIMENEASGKARLVAGLSERIRRRDPAEVAGSVFEETLSQAGLERERLAYVATTGEGELVAFRTGHFYGMTTHARGGLFLDPEVRSVIDIGALHARAVLFDERAKVLGYRMTSQCASGSGQFLENICRYLGTTIDEIGPMSLEADKPEPCSSICAVLAETDVINMVSRGIATSNIIRGIHDSMAGRYLRLLVSAGARGATLVTGGLAADRGLLAALRDAATKQKHELAIRAHEHSSLAGAIGAGLWGAFRVRKLRAKGVFGLAPAG